MLKKLIKQSKKSMRQLLNLAETSLLQTKLEEQTRQLDTRTEAVVAQLTRAEAYQTAKSSLETKTADEKGKAATLDQLAKALSAAQATKPEQERLGKEITALELLLPSYDELEKKLTELADKETVLETVLDLRNSVLQNKITLTEEVAALQEERNSLESAAAEKEKLQGQHQILTERKEKFEKLISSADTLETERNALAVLQKAYLDAETTSSQLKQEYDAKNRAFLDEQAGILAATLTIGLPCPVCGSTEHPCPAVISESAPTEADVKNAKADYESAQKKTEQASSEASTQRGVVSTSEESLYRESQELLGEIGLKDVRSAAAAQEAELTTQINHIKQQIKDAEKKEQRKSELDKQIPQKERALSDAETSLSESSAQIAALTAAAEEVSLQVNALREKLPFADKDAVLAEKDTLAEKQDGLKTALATAETDYNTCKDELTSIRAAIAELEKQLSEESTADVDTLTSKKEDLVMQKSATNEKLKNIHARLNTNMAARKNMSAKEKEMAELESRYTWIKALSDTANGSVTGKDKVMLETYVQTTYFDRILERANLRLRKMSGGQYDLERRQAADNKKAQSGLDLDIIDHINTTRRSVNTLSGGEAFLASLALALGLSDEVQMSTGIHLDTLFVDEGFGSLDSESLSKAYQTLAGLTEGNRLVGIISPVAELKEKIDKQIVVKKDLSGGSHATINV